MFANNISGVTTKKDKTEYTGLIFEKILIIFCKSIELIIIINMIIPMIGNNFLNFI
jgi:hypothetical protein